MLIRFLSFSPRYRAFRLSLPSRPRTGKRCFFIHLLRVCPSHPQLTRPLVCTNLLRLIFIYRDITIKSRSCFLPAVVLWLSGLELAIHRELSFQTGGVPPLFFCCCLSFCLVLAFLPAIDENVQYHSTSFPMRRCHSQSAKTAGVVSIILRPQSHVLSMALENGR